MINDEHIKALNELSAIVHNNAVAKGFYDNNPNDINYIARAMINTVGEIAELFEAARKDMLDKPCDKDIGLTCEEEELADLMIRPLDYARRRGINIGRAVAIKHQYNTTREHRHGGKLA